MTEQHKKSEIDDLEKILNSEPDIECDILPSGEIQYREGAKSLRVQLAQAQTEIERLRERHQAEINLWRESADSMKACWNAACADVDRLQAKAKAARVEELQRLLRDLDDRGSYRLLGFGAKDYLRRVVEQRIAEI